jgi:preprotein translocase subunit SecB
MADQEQGQAKFGIRKIYLKDVSFESPQAPQIFVQSDVTPKIDVQIRIGHTVLDKETGFYEVVLTMTITAKSGDQTTFLIEAQQAGVFEIMGISDQELPLALEVACPNALLPFAREAVSDFVAKGGFPQLLINPVNFEALYLQKQQQIGEQASTPPDQAEEENADEAITRNPESTKKNTIRD